LTYPDGKQVKYTYDNAYRLIGSVDWAGRSTRYQWDANDRVTKIEFPNRAQRTMEYDMAGRLIHRRERNPQGAIIVEYRYSYDAEGNVTSEDSSLTSPRPLPASVGSMTYDSDDRLTSFNGQTVTIDAEGNLTRGPLASITSDFRYDFNNNLTQAGNVSYTYDEEDHLIAIANGGAVTRYFVDPSGALSRVLTKTGPSGIVTRYVYGIGLAYEETNGQIKVYHFDQRGSTVALTDGSGAVTDTASYGPFGELVSRSGLGDTPFLFNGLFGVLTDPNGLNYMRFRWYSPEMKRFLSEDAHLGAITDISSLNRYTYAGNNPLILTDPNGQNPLLLGALVGAAVNVAATLVVRGVSRLAQGRSFVEKGEERKFVAELAGAAIGGAISGFGAAAILTCPPCAAAAPALGAGVGAVSGAVGNLTTAGIAGEAVDPTSVAIDAAFGAAFGALSMGKGAKSAIAEAKAANDAAQQAAKAANSAAQKEYIRRLSITAINGVPPPKPPPVVASILKPASKITASSVGLDFGVNLFQNGLALIANMIVNQGNQAEPEGENPTSNLAVRATARQETVSGTRGRFGEFIHWNIYLNSLQLALRPLPNNPNNLLTAF
jgi:RHS repeat-associated protein